MQAVTSVRHASASAVVKPVLRSATRFDRAGTGPGRRGALRAVVTGPLVLGVATGQAWPAWSPHGRAQYGAGRGRRPLLQPGGHALAVWAAARWASRWARRRPRPVGGASRRCSVGSLLAAYAGVVGPVVERAGWFAAIMFVIGLGLPAPGRRPRRPLRRLRGARRGVGDRRRGGAMAVRRPPAGPARAGPRRRRGR